MATGKKIAAEGTVKSYTRTPAGLKLAFKGVLFADGQRELIDAWMDESYRVRVTVEQVEEKLYDGQT